MDGTTLLDIGRQIRQDQTFDLYGQRIENIGQSLRGARASLQSEK